ncbi:PREDICTED: trihelix transcription factor GT-3b-like [Populus euphratica]|uniref:Trihelix transcription factor GT-3b-like n=1 Tax=Populus euphratica TaxID=75702 RepID=A0AAJ6XEK9_POPEU|nr:PREDICTED: trihelix transcription factor GT-3b-like [Populus euphratica]
MMFRSGGGEGDVGLGWINMMPTAAILSPTTEISPRGPPPQHPQWGLQETKELIGIRAELEKDFTVTKRNETLWEIVSAKMREKGYYRRTPEQCKCKWNNLVSLYKVKETSDSETGRQCPFFEELHEVFTERAKNMQRLLLESEAGSTQSRKKVKRINGDRSSDELSEDVDEDESEEEKPARNNSRRRKGEKNVAEKSPRASSSFGGVQEMLKEFFQQQQKMEMQWRELMEKRAHEWQMLEQEGRRSMDKLERERLVIEQAWREREEQRRIREESRAKRRDALLTALLKKLASENAMQD